jgi:hypothetical protein
VVLDSYANLQAAIGAHLNRTDLAAVIPDFITLAEVRFRRELKDWLRTTLTATNVTGDLLLATTVQEVRSVSYNDGTSGAHNFPLDLLSREKYQQLMDVNANISSLPGQGCYVDADVDANTTTLRFWPPIGSTAPIANLKIEAIKVLPALSASQTTNALLRDAPDVYLFGALAESAPYLQHDERLAMWEARLAAGVKALRAETHRRLYGGTPRPTQLERVFG